MDTTIPPPSSYLSCLPSASHMRCAPDPGLSPRWGVKCPAQPTVLAEPRLSPLQTIWVNIGRAECATAQSYTIYPEIRFWALWIPCQVPAELFSIKRRPKHTSTTPRRLRDWPESSPLYSVPLISLCNCTAHSTFTKLCQLKWLFYSACTILTYGEQHLKQSLVSLTKRENVYSFWPQASLIPPNSADRLN